MVVNQDMWTRRVLDVVIHTTGAIHAVPWSLVESHPPIDTRKGVADEIWIGKIGTDLATAVMNACDPAGFWHHQPTRQFAELYSYVRERQMPLANSFGWDEDSRLQTCVTLSRLLHPTTVSFQYSARVILKLDDRVDEIIPGPVLGLGSEAWIPSTTNYRNWLTHEDLTELRELVKSL